MNIEELLDSLRWKPDMIIQNDFGEVVWLKECFNAAGERIGITDCCMASAPCEWHSALSKQTPNEQTAAGNYGDRNENN